MKAANDDDLDVDDPVLDYLTCGEEDEITGARCTLLSPHDPPHRDESDWGVLMHFKHGSVPELILPPGVPNPGTEYL